MSSSIVTRLDEEVHSAEDEFSDPMKELLQQMRSDSSVAIAKEVIGHLTPEDEEKLLGYPPDDSGNADAVLFLYKDVFRYCPAYGWLEWTGTHWSKEAALAHSHLQNVVAATLRIRNVLAELHRFDSVTRMTRANTRQIRDCIARLEARLHTDISEFDKKGHLLNCLSGVINCKTGEVLPHHSSQRFTECVQDEWDLHTPTDPLWLKFLHENVADGSDEVIESLQRAVGYSITGDTSEECLFYIYGPTRSGKGTFTETVRSILGATLSHEVDFSTFTEKKYGDSSNFDLAPLKQARLIVASESNKYQSLNPAKIKQLTGGNDIRCCFKHKDFFSYRPQYKIWLVSNHEINGDPDDDALWGRIRLIPFPNSHLGNQDKTLKKRLTSSRHRRGVFAWMVQGAMKFYQDGGLTTPQQFEVAKKQQREDQDTVQQWIEQSLLITNDDQDFVSNETLRQSYAGWCKAFGQIPKNDRNLGISLKAKGLERTIRRVKIVNHAFDKLSRITGSKAHLPTRVDRGVLGIKIVKLWEMDGKLH